MTRTRKKVPGPWAFQIAPSEPGKPAAMDVKISRDMPLPTPFSVTSSPIHMIRPVPAVSVMMIRTVVTMRAVRDDGQLAVRQQLAGPCQRHQCRGVEQAECDREVTGVLGQLRLPRCALLVQLLEAGNDHPEQLDDDAGGDVRHDAEGKDGHLQQCTAAEQVDELVDPARGLTVLQALLDILVAHTRRGDEGTQAEDCDDSQREQQLASQIRRAKGPAKCAKQASS